MVEGRSGVGSGPATHEGPVVDLAEGPHGSAAAVFDRDRTYRYLLARTWDPEGSVVAFVMLNPSTADAATVDPTVRRCIGFARSWGHGGVEVVNLFALRATRPQDLLGAAEPVGPDNDRILAGTVDRVDRVVVAWGTHGTHLGRDRTVAALVAGRGVVPEALGRTRSGQPRHPLYVPGATHPVPWVPA